MKKKHFSFITKWAVFALLLLAVQLPAARAQYYQNDIYGDGEPNAQTFYDDLSAYGQWVQDAQYGYVWVPEVDADFRPYYTRGHWVMTEYGNTWVSDYPWGWAAFHYGRWTYNSYYGWVWIPGYTWGPAWVGWRYGGGYYGWAPLGPGFEFGANFGNYYCPDDWWIFIAPAYLYERHYYRYWYGPHDNAMIIGHTGFINNTYYNNNVTYVIGPRPTEVHQITGREVPVYHLTNAPSRTGSSISGRELRLYHPLQISQNGFNGSRPAPHSAVKAPQNLGTPRATGTTPATPAFHNDLKQNNVLPVPVSNPNRQEQNSLPITPVHKEVVPHHNIQTDEHVTPAPVEPARPVQAPQNFNYSRPQPGENVPQQGNNYRPAQNNNVPPPQPYRPQPAQPAAPQQQQHFNNPPQQQQHFNNPPVQPQRIPQTQRQDRQAPPRNEPTNRR